VADGTWKGVVRSGALNARVTITVTTGGRIVDFIGVKGTCAAGAGGSFGEGPGAEEFISAAGSVQGPDWHGQFSGAGVLQGSFVSSAICAGRTPSAESFTARHIGRS
jgi:hypothetical protein